MLKDLNSMYRTVKCRNPGRLEAARNTSVSVSPFGLFQLYGDLGEVKNFIPTTARR